MAINVKNFIEENRGNFKPPVCLKMMHNDDQMKLFVVGGPNERLDYHIEAGEELFHQIEGDMCLKVVEKGKHRDVIIKEGDIFLLPSRIQHSPQRKANTVGFVIERYRHEEKGELDSLRYFVRNEDNIQTMEILYDNWFYCSDLSSLKLVIDQFYASEEYKTGKPSKESETKKPPFETDNETELQAPFNLKTWIDDNYTEIEKIGYKRIFDEKHQFQVFVYGQYQTAFESSLAETWFWVIDGNCRVKFNDVEHNLGVGDSVLVPINTRYEFNGEKNCAVLVCYQDPTKSVCFKE